MIKDDKGRVQISAITKQIISCAMKVHNTLGNGIQEVIYHRALAIEIGSAGFEFAREVEIPVFSCEQEIGTRQVDFLVAGKILVELQALMQLEDVRLAQGLNY